MYVSNEEFKKLSYPNYVIIDLARVNDDDTALETEAQRWIHFIKNAAKEWGAGFANPPMKRNSNQFTSKTLALFQHCRF